MSAFSELEPDKSNIVTAFFNQENIEIFSKYFWKHKNWVRIQNAVGIGHLAIFLWRI